MAQLLLGLTAGVCATAPMYISRVSEERDVTDRQQLLITIDCLGCLIGPASTLPLASYGGTKVGAFHVTKYTAPAVLSLLLFVVGLVLVLVVWREPAAAVTRSPGSDAGAGAAPKPWRHTVAALLSVAMLASLSVMAGWEAAIVVLTEGNFGWYLSANSVMFVVVGAVMFAGTLATRPLMTPPQPVSDATLALVANGLYVVGLLFLCDFGAPPLAKWRVVLSGLCVFLANPLMVSILFSIMSKHNPSAAWMGCLSAALGLGRLLGPVLGTHLLAVTAVDPSQPCVVEPDRLENCRVGDAVPCYAMLALQAAIFPALLFVRKQTTGAAVKQLAVN